MPFTWTQRACRQGSRSLIGAELATEDAASEVPEDELVPLSALQHMLYCPRQCALIHVEQQWAENRLTAEGRVMHGRAHGGGHEARSGVRIARSVTLRSLRLGVAGVADVVEIRADGSLYPVEYKRGRPKAHRADEVQLCAQAMCLEEMLGVRVPEGALFYGRNRRRHVVKLDIDLRALTERIAAATRRLLGGGRPPIPEYEARKCDACSLQDLCQPRQPRGAGTVAQWLASAIDA